MPSLKISIKLQKVFINNFGRVLKRSKALEIITHNQKKKTELLEQEGVSKDYNKLCRATNHPRSRLIFYCTNTHHSVTKGRQMQSSKVAGIISLRLLMESNRGIMTKWHPRFSKLTIHITNYPLEMLRSHAYQFSCSNKLKRAQTTKELPQQHLLVCSTPNQYTIIHQSFRSQNHLKSHQPYKNSIKGHKSETILYTVAVLRHPS